MQDNSAPYILLSHSSIIHPLLSFDSSRLTKQHVLSLSILVKFSAHTLRPGSLTPQPHVRSTTLQTKSPFGTRRSQERARAWRIQINESMGVSHLLLLKFTRISSQTDRPSETVTTSSIERLPPSHKPTTHLPNQTLNLLEWPKDTNTTNTSLLA
jgi:hypothetical protein